MAHGLRSPGVQTDRPLPVLSRPLRGRRCSRPAPRFPLGRLPWQPLPGPLDLRLSPVDRVCLRLLRPQSVAVCRPLRPLHGRDPRDLPPDPSPLVPPSAAPLCPLLPVVPVGSPRPRLPSVVAPQDIRLPLPGRRPRPSKATVPRHRRPLVPPRPLPDTRSKARHLRFPVDSPPRRLSPRRTSRSRRRSSSSRSSSSSNNSPPQVQATDPS